MSEEIARLTLAFVGEQEVHRNNARALLDDMVDGWQKQHRKGEVKVVLHGFPLEATPSQTMDDIDDWAQTSGYAVMVESPEGIVTLLLGEPDPRLILVGDPNDDDTLYDVVEEAAKYRIQTRSLINGLEKVVFDDDELDDDLAGLHEVDVETGEGWADEDLSDEAAALLAALPDVEDVPEDDGPPDLDILAALADDGEVEAQQEITSIAKAAGLDVTSTETWVEAVEAIRAKTGEPDEPVEEIAAAFDAGEKGITAPPEAVDADLGADLDEEKLDMYPGKKYSRAELEAATFDEVKALGLDYGIAPGRGMTHGVYVNKILKATGVETDPPKRKRAQKPKLESVSDTTEVKDTDSEDGSNVIPIHEVVQGHSLKEIADSLRHYADVLEYG